MVAVAQLVEPRIVIPVVAGSIPVSHPIPPPLCHFEVLKPGFWLSLFISTPKFAAVAFFSEGPSGCNTFCFSFLKLRQIDSIDGRLAIAFLDLTPEDLYENDEGRCGS